MNDRVLLAASGGVDSSVSAYLLKEHGYDVHCAVFMMSDQHVRTVEAARRTADELGLPLEVVDLRERFSRLIIKPFCESYVSGRTPSPCVMCNPLVKFAALRELADSLGIEKLATGHYARIVSLEKGRAVAVADCLPRDQSYMLYRLGDDILDRLILPLGSLTKDEVRRIAGEQGLTSSGTPDSEENCFIPDGDYVSYLEEHGYRGPSGDFLLPDGSRISHKGLHRYTVGQRKGLGVSWSVPLYVKRLDPSGDVELCVSGEEYSSFVRVEDAVMRPDYRLSAGDRFSVKIRSAAKPVPACVSAADNSGFTLLFDPPVRAACPGQSAVLYDGSVVAGGGVISYVSG